YQRTYFVTPRSVEDTISQLTFPDQVSPAASFKVKEVATPVIHPTVLSIFGRATSTRFVEGSLAASSPALMRTKAAVVPTTTFMTQPGEAVPITSVPPVTPDRSALNATAVSPDFSWAVWKRARDLGSINWYKWFKEVESVNLKFAPHYHPHVC